MVSIETVLNEMDGYMSYLEDIKKSRLDSHKEMIGKLSERIRRIEKTL
jgi:hypothetical protein